MICVSCVRAGDLNTEERLDDAEVWHSRCRYPSSCTCEHAIGPGWVNRGNARS